MGELKIGRLFACWVMAASFASQVSARDYVWPSPTEVELAKKLGGADVVKIIREADRVEAGRVLLKGKVIETRKPVEVPTALANRAKALMGDRTTYLDGSSECVFDPGVELLFHDHERSSVTLVLCLHCADVSVMRDGKEIGFASFAIGQEKVLALMREVFPKDADIRQLIEERETTAKHNADAQARWLAGMPKSLRPYWENMPTDGVSPDLRPLRVALAREFPDPSQRILALLTWYGCGDGAWSGFPSYEETAEMMLLDYSTADLLSAVVDKPLTGQQLEGAARLFGGWQFGHDRPDERAMLPRALKKTLLAHEMKSPIKDNRERAKRAFR